MSLCSDVPSVIFQDSDRCATDPDCGDDYQIVLRDSAFLPIQKEEKHNAQGRKSEQDQSNSSLMGSHDCLSLASQSATIRTISSSDQRVSTTPAAIADRRRTKFSRAPDFKLIHCQISHRASVRKQRPLLNRGAVARLRPAELKSNGPTIRQSSARSITHDAAALNKN
jgi:hypothetical protein